MHKLSAFGCQKKNTKTEKSKLSFGAWLHREKMPLKQKIRTAEFSDEARQTFNQKLSHWYYSRK